MLLRFGRVHRWRRGGFALRWCEGGTGPVLLFLHGGGLPLDSFEKACADLARHYRVVAPDIPGWGMSSTPPITWDYADYAGLFRDWLRDCGIEPELLVGYSFGGGIAATLAPLLPSLRRLVLLSPALLGYPYRHGMLLPLIAAEAFSALRHAVQTRRIPVYVSIGFRFVATFVRHPRTQYRTFRVILRSFLRCRPDGVSLPATSIISASADRFFPVAGGEDLARAVPHASMEVVGGIHLWPLLEHDKAMTVIHEHLRRPESAAAKAPRPSRASRPVVSLAPR